MTAAPAIKKTDFQKSCKKNVQDPQLVLVERLASPYRQSIASALRLAVRTSPFHGENRGSIPLGRASDFNGLAGRAPKYVKYPSNKSSVVISGLSCSALDTLGSRGFIEPLIDVGKSYDNASWIYDPCR